MINPLLECVGLRKAYPGVLALDDVSITIEAGDVVGLCGRNGAGKSTLIRALSGAVQPDAGSIRMSGGEVDFASPLIAQRHGVVTVHQELINVPNLTVAENVGLGLGYERRHGLFSLARQRGHAAKLLRQLGSEVDPGRLTGELSVAEQRVVMIARALAANAQVLILDEPSASLSAAEIDHLHLVVKRLAERKVAVIYVSHRLDEVARLTTRTVVMRDGRVVANSLTPDLSHAQLVEAITGRSAAAPHPVTLPAASPGRELLRTANLTRHGVFEDVDVVAHSGEVVGIAGLVGAGRTELARAIFGADAIDSGTVYVAGTRAKIRSPRGALKRHLALLPEDRRGQGLVLDDPVWKNVSLASLPRHRHVGALPWPSKKSERAAAKARLSELAVTPRDVERPVRWFSGGNQQKIVIGKWLEAEADIYLFDEPTHGIDVGAKAEFHTLMRRLADRGKAVVFISSEFGEISAVCDRTYVMREGHIVAELARRDTNLSNLTAHCYGLHGKDRAATIQKEIVQ
ncbi:sugar ABC transporter ATP-binding protein [Nocardioides immobilis]|uniref:Sugar ABC transporter ATP-binding protein n=1 Tax=Nocardioides immobilis TaxID=2049295 RepID=A0A417XWP5_9ACTN|nr:sugar ABC transporter ATP-binding protein [Nocardioides immobilis]RHW24944.1 sugar ABC transporter ATP-binding protein [Nocardioides immobilis]